jgi:hypothetical protein
LFTVSRSVERTDRQNLSQFEMLYLVTIPGRNKRIQQNAESAEEAVRIIYGRLEDRMKDGVLQSDCSAEECPDPMSQFVTRSEEDGL